MSKKIDRLEDLIPDRRNANKGTPRGRGMVEGSLRKYGAGRSILADRNGQVIAGNKTLEAAAEIGLPIRVIETNGHELVVVQRTDLDLDEDASARELAIADNRSSEAGLEWDTDVLTELAQEVDLKAFWADDELAALLNQTTPEPGAGGDEFDTTPDEGPTRTHTGELWQLGDHRLMVGDCTDPAVVARLMDGERAQLVFEDPPYNVSYQDNESIESLKARNRRTDGKIIANDAMTDPDFDNFLDRILAALPLAIGGSYYLCAPPGHPETQFRNALNRVSGCELRQCIVWVKDRFVFGRQDYHWRHESILYGWKEGAAHYFIDDHTQDTVWEIERPTASPDHPTQKPIELPERAIRNSSRTNDIVFDGFLGSGTTIIAAQRTGRRCYGCEIEPKYCDVILRRWEAETGETAVLIDTPMPTEYPHADM